MSIFDWLRNTYREFKDERINNRFLDVKLNIDRTKKHELDNEIDVQVILKHATNTRDDFILIMKMLGMKHTSFVKEVNRHIFIMRTELEVSKNYSKIQSEREQLVILFDKKYAELEKKKESLLGS